MDSDPFAYLKYMGCAHEQHAMRHSKPPEGTCITTMTSLAKIQNVQVSYKILHATLTRPGVLPTTIDGVVVESSPDCNFAGQCTIVLRMSPTRKINMKIFNTGTLQCTGVDHPLTGVAAIRGALKLCERHGVLRLMDADIPPSVDSYITINMNTTCRFPYMVCRPALYTLLLKHHLYVRYDPSINSGVVLKYFTNSGHDKQDGRCHCVDATTSSSPLCVSRRGAGYRLGECRRVTVTFFESGKILINGSRTYTQLHEVYEFVFNICKRHTSSIRLRPIKLQPTSDTFNILDL